jgi:hypothetical protein
VVQSDALAMERIDAAGFAEIVCSRKGVERIGAQRVLAGDQAERALMDFDHQCVLAAANGAIASCHLGKVSNDLKANRAAVATARVCFLRSIRHDSGCGR